MRAYHIRGEAGALNPFEVLDSPTVDGLYVPEISLFVGFVARENNRGEMVNYSTFSDRAHAIVDGKRPELGCDVVGEVELDPKTVKRMSRIPRRRAVKTKHGFDGSTDCLVDILSGEYKCGLFRMLFSRK